MLQSKPTPLFLENPHKLIPFGTIESISFHQILPEIKKVVFNDPATIIIWKDESKTMVKCGKNDTYDKEKGLAMCICKKVFGNKSSYNNIFKKWIGEEK